MKKKQRSLNVFFAGELFNLKHLIGNAYLAEAIYEKSHGRYLCMLPQDFDPRGTTPRTIRDHHIRSLVGCDLALFSFDGADLDSGTLAEFMIAKFADIPSVILRSDRRGAGGRGSQWNPMANYYPRTAVLSPGRPSARTRLDPEEAPPEAGQQVIRLAGQHSSADAQSMCDDIAAAVVRAFDRVRDVGPVMPRHLREERSTTGSR